MGNLMPKIGIIYAGLPDNTKHFVSETGAAVIGIVLFSYKKMVDRKIKKLSESGRLNSNQITEIGNLRELSLSSELYEIFMFLIMPGLALYGVFPNQIKATPEWIPIIFVVIVGAWYGISQVQIAKQHYEENRGKIVNTNVDTFLAYALVIFVISMGLILSLRSIGIFNQ